MRKLVVVFLFICCPQAFSANNFYFMDNFELWSNTYETDVIRVVDLGGIQNPESCGDPDSYYVSTALSSESQNRIYSTLMAAKISGKTIEIVLNGCEGNKPRLVSVLLK